MRLFNICFMLSIVPVDWVIACMVPLYKGKGDVYKCSNFRGISLLSVVGIVYGRVLINPLTPNRCTVHRYKKSLGCRTDVPYVVTKKFFF